MTKHLIAEPPESDHHLIEISGMIAARRCLGKHLSFVTLARDDYGDPATTRRPPIKVAFRRAQFDALPSEADNQNERRRCLPFPVKSSDLPYGARVQMQVVAKPGDAKPSYEVRSWCLVGEHPRTLALQAAETSNGAVSCTDYFKARGDLYRRVQPQYQPKPSAKEPRRTSTTTHHENNQPALRDTAIHDETCDCHGSRGSGRARVFAEWLVQNLPLQASHDKPPPTVLDVAGGKGELSVQLAKLGVACTVMDPLIRSKRSLRKLDTSRKHVASDLPAFVAAYFESNQATDEIVANYDCLVGFHPDECTETILDMALKHNKVFAIVPCCVFPSLFPLRTLQGGKQVQSYEEFLEYLLQKDDRSKRASLPMEGKNQVIFLNAPSP